MKANFEGPLQECYDHNSEFSLKEPSMGWDELCTFLNKKVLEVPLPRNNDRAKMEKIAGWRIMFGAEAVGP